MQVEQLSALTLRDNQSHGNGASSSAAAAAAGGASAVAIDESETIEARIRRWDPFTIHTALHQLTVERMGLIAHPLSDDLITFLSQLDANDVHVAVNVLKHAMKHVVHTAKFLLMRARRLVRATKLVRMVWLASRFRFAVKIQKLVAQWRRDEDTARKRLLKGSAGGGGSPNDKKGGLHGASAAGGGGNRRLSHGGGGADSSSSGGVQDEEDFVLQQFLSLEAPVELKRAVFLRQFRRLQLQYRIRWRTWRSLKATYENNVERGRSVHGPPPPPEPKFDWFGQLMSLTAGQRFELALHIQLSHHHHGTSSSKGAQPRSATTTALGGTAAAAAAAAGGGSLLDDRWVTLSLISIARHARQLDERAMRHMVTGGGSPTAALPQQGSSPSRVHALRSITSRYQEAAQRHAQTAQLQHHQQMRLNRYGDLEQQGNGEIRAVTVPELLKEVPGLARFYREPQVDAPVLQQQQHNSVSKTNQRSQVVTSQHRTVRSLEPPSLQALDPFARSLVLKGVQEPPTSSLPFSVASSSSGGPKGGRIRSAAALRVRSREAMQQASEDIRAFVRSQGSQDAVAAREALLRGDRVTALLLASSKAR